MPRTSDEDNPGIVLAKQLDVDVDGLHDRMTACKNDPGTCVIISAAEAEFLLACVEVACEY